MRCRICNSRMVSKAGPPPAGAKRHHGRGLCVACYSRQKRTGGLGRYPPLVPKSPRSHHRGGDCEFCEDVRWMAETGASPAELVGRLSTTAYALSRRLWRHGQRDLARRVYNVREAA